MPAILVDNLSKTYHVHHKEPGLRGSLGSLVRRKTLSKRAVDGISFRIQPGEVVGFLGPNGAGKTTTLKMLSGLLYPTAGTATVLGHVPARREREYLRQIAFVMGQKSMLWWDLPAMETLLLHRDMYGLPDAEFHRTVRELAELLDVGHLQRVQVRKLSLGERMKMELLAALVHRPRVLFLDEPTIGLDVVSRHRVRTFLGQLNREQGITMLLTSHYMEDIEELCPRVLVMHEGHLYFDGALAALVERTAPRKLLTAVFAAPVAERDLLAAIGETPPRRSKDPLTVTLEVPRHDVAEIAGSLMRVGKLEDLNVEEVPVEEIIREVFEATPAGRS
jgi:ABC-2 type transport system ATP-binding protein